MRMTALSLAFNRLYGSLGAVLSFNPANLFSSGEEGAFFDFSNSATLFQDSNGTTAVTAVGDPVGYATDLSGNGNHATQATSTARPLWARVPEGGRRNEIANSEFDAPWGTVSSQTYTTGNTDFFGGSTALRFTNTTSTGDSIQVAGGIAEAGETYCLSCYVKVPGTTKVRLNGQTSLQFAASATVQFTDGVPDAAAGGSEIIEDVGDGWYRIAKLGLGVDVSTTTAARFYPNVDNTGACDVTVCCVQLEKASTPSAYQKVTADYDITEAGVASVYYILDDGVDDSLNVTMPNLGADATRALVNHDLSLTYLENQTIGAGTVDVALDKSAAIYIDRDLTVAEKSDLEGWAV